MYLLENIDPVLCDNLAANKNNVKKFDLHCKSYRFFQLRWMEKFIYFIAHEFVFAKFLLRGSIL